MSATDNAVVSEVSQLPPALARSLRFSALLSPETLALTGVSIIGVGSIGFALAKIFSAMGIGTIHLIDPDVVSGENLGPQQWPEEAIGETKISVAIKECLRLNPRINIAGVAARFSTLIPLQPYVFCCVDSMAVRSFLSTTLKQNPPPLFVDTRMGAQIARVHICRPLPLDYKHYESTLFPDAEATQAPCTLKSTTHCAQLAASLAASALVHLLAYPESPYPYEFFRSFLTPEVDYTLLREIPSYPTTPSSPAPTTASFVTPPSNNAEVPVLSVNT